MKSEKRLSALLCTVLILAFLMSAVSSAASIVSSSNNSSIPEQEAFSKRFYVPPYYDITKAKFNFNAEYVKVGGGEKISYKSGDTIDVTPGKTTDKNGNPCYKITAYEGSYENNYYLYVTSEIPNVYITTSLGLSYIHQNKNNRDKAATVQIFDEKGSVVYDDISAETYSEMKGRGNATWSERKKPYQIKLGKKTDLFGMGKAKTWILLANYIDSSYIRNAITYEIADALELPFTPNSVYVNLYIDDEYHGLYQLAEKTQIGSNRIEIADLEENNELANSTLDLDSLSVRTVTSGDFINNTNVSMYTYVEGMENPDDITGGYLVEMDNLYYYREKCYFKTDNGNTFVVKSPECASKEQMEYISKLFSEMEEGIYSYGYNSQNKHFSEYCDVDSLLKVYMVQEIVKNWDAYVGSTFFYKDADVNGVQSKIYAGPVWDFDNAFGNLNRGTFGTDVTALWANGYNSGSYKCDFGGNLAVQEGVEKQLEEYYKTASTFIKDMLEEDGFVNKLVDKIYDSVAADRMRWPDARHKDFKQYSVYCDDEYSADTAIGALKDFMGVRAEGLATFFVTGSNDDEPEATQSSTPENTVVPTTVSTVVPTTEQTQGSSIEDNSSTPTDDFTDDPGKTGGCASSFGAGAAVVTLLVTAFALVKRKE